MPAGDYHSQLSSWSKTMLSHFVDSRVKAYHYYIAKDREPPKPSKQMLTGTVCHEVILEQKELEDLIAVYDDSCFKSNGHLNPKPAREFEAANEGKYCVRAAEAESIYDCLDRVMSSPIGDLVKVPSAVFETPIFWKDEASGLDCRCCPDIRIDMGGSITCVDLKFSTTPSERDFERSANRFGYYLQDAHYSAGVQQEFGKPVNFVFWVIEPEWPHRIGARYYSQQTRDMASSYRERLLADVADCIASNDWREPWMKEAKVMNVGPWDLEGSEVEEIGFDDE